ncbi:MAG: hypothetical protein KAU94_05055 [Verrucomicrobia bacterium]|nr:hypothetical protein [Verrucomicrobiota bacterium]
MKDKNNHLYTENTKMLQIPYKEYVALVEKAAEGQRCREIKDQVLAGLAASLGEPRPALPKESQPARPQKEETAEEEAMLPPTEKVSVEYSAPEPDTSLETEKKEEPVAPAAKQAKQPMGEEPPIKKDIAEHFNRVDGSGRLLNIFKQYYTCMNGSCGGTVRVTIKDGICSIWNYDEWEEFAFVDVFDGRLRIGVNPRYTEQLKSLDLCAVPRLLASRHNLICVQVDDLNQAVLDTLIEAFNQVGMAA